MQIIILRTKGKLKNLILATNLQVLCNCDWLNCDRANCEEEEEGEMASRGTNLIESAISLNYKEEEGEIANSNKML